MAETKLFSSYSARISLSSIVFTTLLSPKPLTFQKNKGILHSLKNRVLSRACKRTGFFERVLKGTGLKTSIVGNQKVSVEYYLFFDANYLIVKLTDF